MVCMKMKKLLLISIVSVFILGLCWSKETDKIQFEFYDQKIPDILYALSLYSGKSIITDETVIGNTTFQYSGISFETALEQFLKANRLYCIEENGILVVSKIRLEKNETGRLTLDAFDSQISTILERLSYKTNTPILFASLPQTKISIHITDSELKNIVLLVLKPFLNYGVEEQTKGLAVVLNEKITPVSSIRANFSIERINDRFSCDLEQIKASEIFKKLCEEETVSWNILLKNDPIITGVHVDKVSYETLLETVLIQAGAESFIQDKVRYFIPSKVVDTGKRAKSLQEFWETKTLMFLSPSKASSLISARFQDIEVIPIEQAHSLIIKTDTNRHVEIQNFIELIDKGSKTETIFLKYLSSSELIKVLPPSLDKTLISETGTGNSIFFSGTEEQKNTFLKELKEIDLPKERIRYDMLIIQYEKSKSSTWASQSEIRANQVGDMTSISGNFSSLLNLNFDVLSLFGYHFSSKLDAAIKENNAKIFTDTSLNAVSGEPVKFKNTSTYRYRDTAIDPDTGKPVYTGVTREIISGITLDILGRISGDGLVTMNILATVSKRGADVASQAGNPPTTSEKSIETKISTQNGEPVILSGLTQNNEHQSEGRIPIISRLPLVGWLFKNKDTQKENSEMIIYVVPHISNERQIKEEKEALVKNAVDRLIGISKDFSF